MFTAIVLASALSAASAADLTVLYNRDVSNNVNGAGFSLGTKLTKDLTLSGNLDRYSRGTDVDSYGVSMSYEVFKLGKLSVSGGLGMNWINVERGKDGLAGSVHAGVALPITKSLSIVTEATRLMPETKIKSQEATIVSVGLRTTF